MKKPYYEDEFGMLFSGDTKEVLDSLPASLVRMSITSPPYWAQRDYKNSGQLGQEQSFKEFVIKLAMYFDSVERVLQNDGTLWVNLDDTFYGSNKGAGGKSNKQLSNKGSHYTIDKGNKGSILENARTFQTLQELKRKSMCLIPERFAIEMIDNHGWVLRNDIVWHKPNAMTESAKDRFSLDYESLFMFSKQPNYFFNQQLEPAKEESIRRAKNGWNGRTIEEGSHKGMSKWMGSQKAIDSVTKGRNKRSVWSINTQPIRGLNHFAKFPETLITTPILAGSNEGDIVLDPFFGSGTTAIVCEKLKRRWIGVELSQQYCDEALNRIFQERTKQA